MYVQGVPFVNRRYTKGAPNPPPPKEILWVIHGQIGHFRVPPGLRSKTRLSAQPLIRKWFFYSHANKTHYHKKGCALGLILKVRVFETQKWPIIDIIGFRVACMNESNETCFKLEELRRYIHF